MDEPNDQAEEHECRLRRLMICDGQRARTLRRGAPAACHCRVRDLCAAAGDLEGAGHARRSLAIAVRDAGEIERRHAFYEAIQERAAAAW